MGTIVIAGPATEVSDEEEPSPTDSVAVVVVEVGEEDGMDSFGTAGTDDAGAEDAAVDSVDALAARVPEDCSVVVLAVPAAGRVSVVVLNGWPIGTEGLEVAVVVAVVLEEKLGAVDEANPLAGDVSTGGCVPEVASVRVED